jgi:DNA replication protein DnaC
MMPNDPNTHPHDTQLLLRRAHSLGLYGLIERWDEFATEEWIPKLLGIEEDVRKKRSLQRRIKHARLGSFKSLSDFDWAWPKTIDRDAVEDLLSLKFVEEGANAILLGPNGVGKTMLLRNIAYQAVTRGHPVCFTTASDMLSDLAAQESSVALARRLRRYTNPKLLCVDEVGYLSYDSRYADLFFEVVSRRYDGPKSILLTTNKPFGEWAQVFPHAACVVTLVDRLLHRAEVVPIEGESYRLKEAKDRAASSKARRPRRKDAPHEHAR